MSSLPTVLVCEDLAHWRVGHYGIRFAELAQGFMETGCDTYALTSVGWAYAGELPFPQARVQRYDWLPALLIRLSRRSFVTGPWRSLFRNLALVLAVRIALRRIGQADALVVVVVDGAQPALLSLLGGRHDWIVHRFGPPQATGSSLYSGGISLVRYLGRLAAARQAARGSKLLVALPDASWIAAWKLRCPGELFGLLRLAGAVHPAPQPHARTLLGLPEQGRIAVVFGAHHKDKQPMVAIEAIKLRPHWTLVVVGQGADFLISSLAPGERPANLLLRPGAVSNSERSLWHQSADAAVLSFVPNYRRNSGTLMDALSARCPVVVSDQSFAADLAMKYGLGEVFAAGDAAALAAALDRVSPLDQTVIDAAFADLGNERLARDHLAAVGRLAPSNQSATPLE
jgi:glycosyltransferase involved in cell wall biosynthesis